MAELCLEFKMTRAELGQRMSNYELCVFWPAFFAERQRLQAIETAKAEANRR